MRIIGNTRSILFKSTVNAILLALLISPSALAGEKECKSLDEVIKYWKLNMQHPASESTVNKECLKNRQALGLQQVEEENRGNNEDPGKNGLIDEKKQCRKKYLILVNKLCEETERMLGLYHLDEAKKSARKPGEEAATENHRQLARQYLGRTAVDNELPEIITLKPRFRVYEFTLKKGEQTGSWIQGEVGTTNFIYLFETTNDAFEVHYKNGEVIKVWAGEAVPKIPNGPFKIVATDDTTVLVMVD